MKIARGSSLRDVAFVVCTALHESGTEAVLTGGSAATVYAPQAYQSRDIDFIVTFSGAGATPGEVLAALGYREAGDHYEHPHNDLNLEFPQGPLAVGGELIRKWKSLREGGMLLHIITPTDSVRDRLAGFLFWNDRGSLDQAVAVARARRKQVDLEAVARWCRLEGKAAAFEEFQRQLSHG
ncbi:MAG: hypothetical protein OEY32_15095 [Candidatus Krumholzibacteria bacterium]|nr:hypothetical protein [Candidatus Krumholzibacteria bacterium]MDH5271240.1 hypothetical protein [Candidatus Krumholzibacteria bacterium]